MESHSDQLTEERINYLSQPLREKTKENSIAWGNKYNFWKERILDFCKRNRTISPPSVGTLRDELKLGTVTPKCLPAILEVMIENGHITPAEDYVADLAAIISAQATWTSWSYDKLVRSPVKWASNKMFSPVARIKQSEFTKFIIRDLVKETAMSLLQSIVVRENPIDGSTILPRDKLFKYIFEIIECDRLESEVIVKFLLAERLALEDHIDGTEVYVLSPDNNQKVRKLTSNQRSVFMLEAARKTLKDKTDSLHDSVLSQDQKIREHLKESSKVRALHALKRKKRLEKQLTQTMNSLDKIETLFDQIHSSKDNSQTLSAIKKGVKLLESINDKSNDADDVMGDLNEQIDRTLEVTETLSRTADTDALDERELEAELNQLLAEDLSSEPTELPPNSDLDDLMIQLDKLEVEAGEPSGQTKTVAKELAF